ncbi:MAG: HAMP domain-containing histidine kinase [Proteobacteria bacterium]|nr:HAMP domain-containing histidine kinase [Pseudomonadota bacterium]
MLIFILVIFMGGYITVKLNRLHQITWKTAGINGQSINILEHLISSVFSIVMFEKKYLISKDQDYYTQFKEFQTYFLNDTKELRRLLDSIEQQQLLAAAKTCYDNYLSTFEKEVETIKSGLAYTNSPDVTELKQEAIAKLNANLNHIIDLLKSERDANIELSSQMSKNILNLTAIITVLTIILGFIISIFNTKSINGSISLLMKKTEEIAEGRFEVIENINAPREIQELASHFNKMCMRLKELDTMKADFISHVSHELRTPMTAIKEASNMLGKGMFVNRPDKQADLLNLIESECKRLIKSVNRILDLSSMEGNMMAYQFKESDLSQIVRNAILKLFPLVQKKDIDLELIPHPAMPLIRLDEERIGEVMENLLGNAIKFTPSNGEIKLSIDHDTLKKEIRVTVSDTGCGIATKHLEDIFDKFKRIDNGIETTRGTGLGLSISKHIITAHGGKIWAESHEIKGTNVFFTLPVS